MTEKVTEKVTEKLTEREKDILEILRNNPVVTYLEIAETMSISRKTVAQEIKVLKDRGHIVRVGSAKKGFWKEM